MRRLGARENTLKLEYCVNLAVTLIDSFREGLSLAGIVPVLTKSNVREAAGHNEPAD
jgi:hypothetical protein